MRAIWIPGGRLARIERELKSPDKALKIIGLHMVAGMQDAFNSQGWDGARWARRRNPNIPGIIHDVLEKNRERPLPRRIHDGPALKDSGDLFKSIAWERYDARSILAGSNLPYAGTHNLGGETEMGPLTKNARRLIWRWLKPKPKALKREIGWILNKKFLKEVFRFKVTRRQFVGMTDDMRSDIEADLRDLFKGL